MQIEQWVVFLLFCMAVTAAVALQAWVIRRTRTRHEALWEDCGRPSLIMTPANGPGIWKLIWKVDLSNRGDTALIKVRTWCRAVGLISIGLFLVNVLGGQYGWFL